MAITGTNLDPPTVLEWNDQNYQVIRRIETVDPVLGGTPTKANPDPLMSEDVLNSPVNYALATLAARTKWLKKEIKRITPVFATQTQAEAGEDETTVMSPKRTKEAIDALGSSGVTVATKDEAEAGTNNTKMMTPLRSAEAIAALVPDASTTTKGSVEIATSAENKAGTDTARVVTPGNFKWGTLPTFTRYQKDISVISVEVLPSESERLGRFYWVTVVVKLTGAGVYNRAMEAGLNVPAGFFVLGAVATELSSNFNNLTLVDDFEDNRRFYFSGAPSYNFPSAVNMPLGKIKMLMFLPSG